MYRSTAWLAVLFAPCLSAQFTGLSSTSDGSSVYFASTLRLKGAAQPLNGKIFVAGPDGVKLFRARETEATGAPAPGESTCKVGGFTAYVGAETSSAGILALSYRTNSSGPCSGPPNTNATQIVSAGGEIILPGVVRLSSGGRFAIRFLAGDGRGTQASISLLDFQISVPKPIEIPVFPFLQLVRIPPSGGRVIANDGTAVIGLIDRFLQTSGYILKPGADPQPFPIPDVLPLLIDAGATKVVFQRQDQSLSLLNLRTLESNFLLRGDQFFSNLNLSDDGRRLLFVRDGQVHLLDTNTLVDRILTNEPAKIAEATLSGDGKVVYAVTGRGGLLKINADDSAALELIGHTPYLRAPISGITPGLALVLDGSGLSDTVIVGTPPLPSNLGNVTMRIGERKAPIVWLIPTAVRILIPWDIAGSFRIVAEAPGRNTPFDFPEVEATVASPRPLAGAIARQDWTQTYVGPVNTGEIIHVFAIGLGPVSPEVPDGAAAPSAEPFSRITQSLTCSNAEILYAGLAPGTVERAYQIDLRIGPTAGYQQFKCSLGGAPLFIFLSLNVLQGSN